MLRIEGLSGGYGDVQILFDVNLEISEGRITALVGANGAGKTTLIRTLAGALSPSSGKIIYEGKDITKTTQPKRAAMGIMMVPEGRQLYAGLTVEENLFMGAYVRKDRRAVKDDLAWVYAVLPRLGERRRQLAGTLSGGEAQMCAVGRGLMASPRVLMLDELSLGLAPVTVDTLIAILQGVQETKKISILLVDQDVQVALGIAEKGYVFVNGRVQMSGDSKTLLENPEIQKAYLGL